MAFDFEHLFSSFHKRSVRDSAYITSLKLRQQTASLSKITPYMESAKYILVWCARAMLQMTSSDKQFSVLW